MHVRNGLLYSFRSNKNWVKKMLVICWLKISYLKKKKTVNFQRKNKKKRMLHSQSHWDVSIVVKNSNRFHHATAVNVMAMTINKQWPDLTNCVSIATKLAFLFLQFNSSAFYFCFVCSNKSFCYKYGFRYHNRIFFHSPFPYNYSAAACGGLWYVTFFSIISMAL